MPQVTAIQNRVFIVHQLRVIRKVIPRVKITATPAQKPIGEISVFIFSPLKNIVEGTRGKHRTLVYILEDARVKNKHRLTKQ